MLGYVKATGTPKNGRDELTYARRPRKFTVETACTLAIRRYCTGTARLRVEERQQRGSAARRSVKIGSSQDQIGAPPLPCPLIPGGPCVRRALHAVRTLVGRLDAPRAHPGNTTCARPIPLLLPHLTAPVCMSGTRQPKRGSRPGHSSLRAGVPGPGAPAAADRSTHDQCPSSCA